jgi:hypothetical protein
VRYYPRRWPGVLVAAGLLFLLATAEAWLVARLAKQTPDLGAFLLGLLAFLIFLLALAVSYLLYCILNLSYEINRNRVLIRWGASERVVPLGQITQIREGVAPRPGRWRGLRWPGYMVGRSETRGERRVPILSFATQPLKRQLVLVTSSLSYGVSPADQRGFLEALAIRRRMGALQSLEQEAHHPELIYWTLWHDPTAWGLALGGAMAVAAQLAYLCWRFPRLPAFLPVHFGAFGQVDRIGGRSELFRLPLIGLLVLLLDALAGLLLHSKERAASYLVLGGALLAQALLGLGLWRLAQ